MGFAAPIAEFIIAQNQGLLWTGPGTDPDYTVFATRGGARSSYAIASGTLRSTSQSGEEMIMYPSRSDRSGLIIWKPKVGIDVHVNCKYF